ncbi:hypothetical protein LX64_02762 [Chitinophaga skermanii]|uniref:Uncharacterized protein n=1 Tax=Chitinophaga skermanii TaxID=331697 RepID=A0A327QIR7_9BACT|nr:hypothetical protein [Chitinophaga skermanii]RAJ03885.1 hypothetical protein LX64_02762 [Chitinophaga skermanii]
MYSESEVMVPKVVQAIFQTHKITTNSPSYAAGYDLLMLVINITIVIAVITAVHFFALNFLKEVKAKPITANKYAVFNLRNSEPAQWDLALMMIVSLVVLFHYTNKPGKDCRTAIKTTPTSICSKTM